MSTWTLRLFGVVWKIGKLSEWKAWMCGGAIAGPWPPPRIWRERVSSLHLLILLFSGVCASLLLAALIISFAIGLHSLWSPLLILAAFFPLVDVGVNMLPIAIHGQPSDALWIIRFNRHRGDGRISFVLFLVVAFLWLAAAMLFLTYNLLLWYEGWKLFWWWSLFRILFQALRVAAYPAIHATLHKA